MNRTNALEALTRDLLYGLRTMRKYPAFVVTAALTLALGIGATTAMFTVVRAVLLKPLAYREPDRLVGVSLGATALRFEELRSRARSFSALGAYTGQENLTLLGGATPEVVSAARVSAGFLRILGASPVLGRDFSSQEDSPGGPASAMISAELWRRKFHSDLHIIGKTVALNETVYTVIGVLPAHFAFPFAGLDIWLTKPSEWPAVPAKSRPLSPFLSLFGRLAPGVSLQQANAEVAVLQHQYAVAHPAMLDAKPKKPVRVTPLKEGLVRDIRSMLWMLFGAVAFVLLIACANVASLLLARASARSREFAVRSALGAARTRLICQLLVESVLLSFSGGLLGCVLTLGALNAIRKLTALDVPRAGEIHVDWTVLAFAVVLSVLTGILFGLWPALGISRPDLIGMLRTRSESVSELFIGAGGAMGRRILVAAQIALSVVLLIGAALLMETVLHLRGENPGFNSANVLTMQLALPANRYAADQKKKAFFEEVLERTQTLPGVKNAAAAMTVPMSGYAGTPVQDASKPPLKLNERPIATVDVVTPGYFRALQIPLRRGRDFGERDRADTQRVAIIDENLARRFWPAYPAGLDPVGQFLLVGGIDPHPAQIIGIVGNVHQTVENDAWPETVYVSFWQDPLPSATLIIRTPSAPARLTSAVRKQIQAVDQDQAVSGIRTMEDLIEAQLGRRRLLMIVLLCFAGAAVMLSMIGIYGVVAYSVTHRTHELGVRRALGAHERDILWLVLRQSLELSLAGTAAGLIGAFALTRVMAALLFHVSATDPATFAGIALLFIAVSLCAGYLPARRATRIDPMQALRAE